MPQTSPQHRAGEIGHFPFRSDRLYFSNGFWFFLIRGGQSKGPFPSAEKARSALQTYIHTLTKLQEAFHRPGEDDHHQAQTTDKPSH